MSGLDLRLQQLAAYYQRQQWSNSVPESTKERSLHGIHKHHPQAPQNMTVLVQLWVQICSKTRKAVSKGLWP